MANACKMKIHSRKKMATRGTDSYRARQYGLFDHENEYILAKVCREIDSYSMHNGNLKSHFGRTPGNKRAKTKKSV
jgi:hypothetical protein